MKGKLLVVLVVVCSVLLVGTAITWAQEAEKAATPTPSAEQGKPEAEKQEVKKIDINSATLKELQTLPGIGPKLSQAIIDQRPYEKVEDIMKVKKIGKKTFAKIKDLIEVKPIAKSEEQKTEEKPKEEPTPKK